MKRKIYQKFWRRLGHSFIYLHSLIFQVYLIAGETDMQRDRNLFHLNGIQIELDAETGSIVKMSSADGCTYLQTTPQRASIIDLAYPVKEFEPLRRASRYSKNAEISYKDDHLQIHWNNLGPSRELPSSGEVSVTIDIHASEDSTSVIFSCSIKNHGKNPVRQVLFPDLMGLLPFAGVKETRLRTATFVEQPFVLLRPDPEMVPFYATGPFKKGNGWVEYKSGRYKSFSQKLVDWLDFGSLKDGFSLFCRRWPPEDADVSLMMHLAETDSKLRLLFSHDIEIKPGETWHSDAFWLTPRRHGWAEGIEPFRKWTLDNISPEISIPDHIRQGMGFRTVWMGKGYPSDGKNNIIFYFKDLPELARESLEHGLNEMVPWFWGNYFELPIESTDMMGSEQELVQAIEACREMGVNVSLFMSVLYLRNPTAARYNLVPAKETSWTYHPELIPIFNPPYAGWNEAVMVDQSNQDWQDDVFASFNKYIKMNLSSFVWDVFMAEPTSPNLYDLTSRIRKAARENNPESVFAGEGGCDLSEDIKYLDYTWNWNWNWPHYKDFRAYTSVFNKPRLNVNIDASVKVVKYCFADNVYMNIMPSAPDGINASDYISNHTELSAALKECAALRKQFLPYFTDGRLIGDCILYQELANAHVSAYTYLNRILLILVKNDLAGEVALTCDPGYWLGSGKAGGTVKIYNASGKLEETRGFNASRWQYQTKRLSPYEILICEFESRIN